MEISRRDQPTFFAMSVTAMVQWHPCAPKHTALLPLLTCSSTFWPPQGGRTCVHLSQAPSAKINTKHKKRPDRKKALPERPDKDSDPALTGKLSMVNCCGLCVDG